MEENSERNGKAEGLTLDLEAEREWRCVRAEVGA